MACQEVVSSEHNKSKAPTPSVTWSKERTQVNGPFTWPFSADQAMHRIARTTHAQTEQARARQAASAQRNHITYTLDLVQQVAAPDWPSPPCWETSRLRNICQAKLRRPILPQPRGKENASRQTPVNLRKASHGKTPSLMGKAAFAPPPRILPWPWHKSDVSGRDRPPGPGPLIRPSLPLWPASPPPPSRPTPVPPAGPAPRAQELLH